MQTTSLFPFRRLLLTLVAALPLLFGTSCSDDDDTSPTPPAGPGNIVQVASGNADFSILVAAVTKANLAATLSGPGPFTVFAPTNAAFAQLPAPFNSAANITAITDATQLATLTGILQYHVLSGTKKAADFATGASTQATVRPATGGTTDNVLYLSKGAAGVFINGSTQVTTPDVPASNGVIHAINRVLMPPSGTVVAAAVATPSLSVLVQALQRPAAAALLAAANNPSANLTVFAPSNTAFQALLTELNFTSLAQVSDATLVSILQAHIVSGTRAFSTDLTNNQVVTTLNGPVTIGVSGTGVTVRAPGNGTNAANVTLANVLTNNGVVHVIDRVLRP